MARDKDKMHRLFYDAMKGRITQETMDFVKDEAQKEGKPFMGMYIQMREEYRTSKELRGDFHRWNKDRLFKEKGPRSKHG